MSNQRTIEQLLAEPVHGYADEHDLQLMTDLGAYVLNPKNPLPMRVKAVHKFDSVMGEETEELPAKQLVRNFIRDYTS